MPRPLWLFLVVSFVLAGVIALAIWGSPATSQEVGATLTVAATVAVFVAFWGQRVDDPRIDQAKVKQRAELVEAVAITIGLPSLVLSIGAGLPQWSAAVFLVVCATLAATFAGTRR